MVAIETPQLRFEDEAWHYFARNVHISEEHRLVYVSTPKVGCTTLKWWLADLTGYTEKIRAFTDSEESTPDLKIHDVFPLVAPEVVGLAEDRLEIALQAEGYFRFAVVRNPFNRIFSAWQSKLLLREPLQAGPYKDLGFFSWNIATAADIAASFQGFLEHLADHEAPFFQDPHWTPQIILLQPQRVNYSHIIKIEDASGFVAKLNRHLGTVGMNPFHTARANESLLPFQHQFITAKSEQLIRRLFKEDFTTFGYTDNLPPQKQELSEAALEMALKAIALIRAKHKRLGEMQQSMRPFRQQLRDSVIELGELRKVNANLLQDIFASRTELEARSAELEELKSNPLIRFILRNFHHNSRFRNLGTIPKRLILWTAGKALRLVPGRQVLVYRALRRIYQRMPVSFETKRFWLEFVMTHCKALRDARFAVYGQQVAGHHLVVMNTSASATEDRLLQPPRKRLLIVEHRLPTPDKTSGSLRLYSIIELLVQRGWEITFASDAKPDEYKWVLKDIEGELPKYEHLLEQLGVLVIYGMENLSPHLQSEGETYTLALLSYPEIMHRYAPLVRAFMPNSCLVYDTVDLHGLRFHREALIKNNDPELQRHAEFYEKMERANLESADVVVAITEDERREILQRNPAACIEVVPNIHSIAPHTPPLDGREGLLFIGHYLHSPNEDAMLYFVQEVLPKICERIGNVSLYMLGSSITDKVAALASETVHAIGFVEDPAPWFARARVFVAPLRYGAGMKGKIGQSLSLGLPIVTTSIGAEGMGLKTDKHVLIADNADDFAAAVVRLYGDTDLWRELSENGKAHVEQNFSHGSVGQAIDRLIAITGVAV
jgi:glycosyltransferase involved in cell wall biosynthesis